MEQLRALTRADLGKAFLMMPSTCGVAAGSLALKKYSECDVPGAGHLGSLYGKLFKTPYSNVSSEDDHQRQEELYLLLPQLSCQAVTLGKSYLGFPSITGVIRITAMSSPCEFYQIQT